MNKKLLFFISLFFILNSCGKKHDFQEIEFFDSLIWNRFDIIEIDVPVKSDTRGLDFTLVFIHSEAYAHDFINMNITFYLPEGSMRSRDYTFRLQDEFGEWHGDAADGFIKVELPVTSGLKFAEDGICRVRLENKMTRFNTQGVIGVGVSAKRAG